MKVAPFIVLTVFSLVLTSCAAPAPQTLPTAAATAVSTPNIQRFPTSTPTITPSPIPTPGDTFYQLDGVTFVVPACMALRPALETIPEAHPDPSGAPGMLYPQHIQVSFDGYPLGKKSFEPLLRVFPVEDFASMSEGSAASVARLQELLASQGLEDGGLLPLLPDYGMTQVFNAQVRFMNFKNGSGARWLTELAPSSVAVNNRDLFYSFQGLTRDGKYWVSLMLPVNAAYLQQASDSVEVPPGGLSYPAAGSVGVVEKLEEYFSLMLIMLNNTPDAGFNPALNCLDGLAASITVSP